MILKLTWKFYRRQYFRFLNPHKRCVLFRYKDEMAVFQDMVTDVPYTELNHSTFWVEFIQRHQEVSIMLFF